MSSPQWYLDMTATADEEISDAEQEYDDNQDIWEDS